MSNLIRKLSVSNTYTRRKMKKKVHEEDPASSDSSDLEYPENREGYEANKRRRRNRYRPKPKQPNIKKSVGKKSTLKRKAKGHSSGNARDEDYVPLSERPSSYSEECVEEVSDEPEYEKQVTPEYLEYKENMEKLARLKVEEFEARKRKKEEQKRRNAAGVVKRKRKTGATPKMVHPLKFVAHGHNRHHALSNDPTPSAERDAYKEALSMGKAQTVDAYLAEKMKGGSSRKNQKEISKLTEYARNRVTAVIEHDTKYMPPMLPIYDDGTPDSVRIGMDIERFTLSRQGLARMDPLTDQLSRHKVSPETSSRERSKRMSEGVIDAVDRDLQDIPKIKNIEMREKKAMESLMQEIRKYHGPDKITSAEQILQQNDLRDKISPLLKVLYNNQHPGLRRNRDFFTEAVQLIVSEDRAALEEQQRALSLANGEDGKKKRRNKRKKNLALTLHIKDTSLSKSDIFGLSAYADTPSPEELKGDPYITQLMEKVPIKYTEPKSGIEITVGHRLVPPPEPARSSDDGEDPAWDEDIFGPVPIKALPFDLKGDNKDQTRMMRSIRKLKDETRLPRQEYESVFEQEMAPREPTIKGLYSVSMATRGTNSTPVNRLGMQVRKVGYNESNRRSGTSLSNAKKRMRESAKVGEDEEEDEEEEEEEEMVEEQPGYDKGEPTPSEIRKSIKRATKERLEDETIMCPRLPNYKEDTREEEEPSVADLFIFNRRSCIMHLVEQQKRKQQELDWMMSAYSRGTSVQKILENPSLYEGAGGQGIAGLGEACSKEYIAAFLREPVGNERPCCHGKHCMGVMLPLLKNWPDTLDITSSDGGPILREFYRPEQFRAIKENRKYPEDHNPCVLCIDFITTQACYSFASNDTAPKCTIQYYHVVGYSKKVLIPMYSSRKHTPTGIILPCKMFRIQDYFLSYTNVCVNGKWLKVRCYEERMYTEDSVGSGGIAATTLDDKPITNEDFWEASVVNANRS